MLCPKAGLTLEGTHTYAEAPRGLGSYIVFFFYKSQD